MRHAGGSKSGPPYLEVDDAVVGRSHTVRTAGELDLASADELEAVIGRLGDADAITLDLSGLTFMDCCGLRSVLRASEACEKPECSFTLVPAHGQVRRLFELTGLLDMLPFQAAA